MPVPVWLGAAAAPGAATHRRGDSATSSRALPLLHFAGVHSTAPSGSPVCSLSSHFSLLCRLYVSAIFWLTTSLTHAIHNAWALLPFALYLARLLLSSIAARCRMPKTYAMQARPAQTGNGGLCVLLRRGRRAGCAKGVSRLRHTAGGRCCCFCNSSRSGGGRGGWAGVRLLQRRAAPQRNACLRRFHYAQRQRAAMTFCCG